MLPHRVLSVVVALLGLGMTLAGQAHVGIAPVRAQITPKCYVKTWMCFGVNPALPVSQFSRRATGPIFYVDNQDGVTLHGTTDSFEYYSLRADVSIHFKLLQTVGGSEYVYTVLHELTHISVMGVNSVPLVMDLPDDIRIAFEYVGTDEVPIPYADNKVDGTDYNSLINPTLSGDQYRFQEDVSVSRRFMFRLCMNVNVRETTCAPGPETTIATLAPTPPPTTMSPPTTSAAPPTTSEAVSSTKHSGLCYEKQWMCFGQNPALPVSQFPNRQQSINGMYSYVDNQDGVTRHGISDSFEYFSDRAGVEMTFYLLRVAGNEYTYTILYKVEHVSIEGINSISFRLDVPDNIRIAFKYEGDGEVPIPFAYSKGDGSEYNAFEQYERDGEMLRFPSSSVNKRFMFRLCMNVNTNEIPCPSGPSTALSTPAPTFAQTPAPTPATTRRHTTEDRDDCPVQCPAGPPGPPGPPGPAARRRRSDSLSRENQSAFTGQSGAVTVGNELIERDRTETSPSTRVHLDVAQMHGLPNGEIVQFSLYISNNAGVSGSLSLQVWRPQELRHVLIHQHTFDFDRHTNGLINIPTSNLNVRRGDRLALASIGLLPVPFYEEEHVKAPCRFENLDSVLPGNDVRFDVAPVRHYSFSAVVVPSAAPAPPAPVLATKLQFYNIVLFTWMAFLTLVMALVPIAFMIRTRSRAVQFTELKM